MSPPPFLSLGPSVLLEEKKRLFSMFSFSPIDMITDHVTLMAMLVL